MVRHFDNLVYSLLFSFAITHVIYPFHSTETGKNDRGRVWSHATEQTWFTSNSGIRNKRFYVASGVWDACPSGSRPNTKWGIARIAVIAHECAHFLGLPDTYDTKGGVGLGSFDLQANMWGWTGTQYYPPLMNAWCKMKLQWVDVVHVKHSGTYSKFESNADAHLT